MLLELNATAAFVWQQLVATNGECDPVQALSARYPDVEPSRLARDVSTVLSQFADAALVEPTPASLKAGRQ
jgi:hypothetical protein